MYASCAYVPVVHCVAVPGSQKEALGLVELKLKGVMSHISWTHKTKSKTSGKVASTLKC